MDTCEDPIAAATHADPYPFYARLVTERPLAWDATHRLWVAASAEAVSAVLSHPACRVRPTAEPVPAPLAATPMGALYAQWIRMTEGAASREGKRAVAAALEALGPVDSLGARVCHELDPGWAPTPEAVTDFMFAVPLHCTGHLLGLPPETLPSVARNTRRLAEGISPLASSAEREAGARAAVELRETLARSEGGLLMEHLRDTRLEWEWVQANAIGLLFQTCEATAGLIGNTLLTLTPEWREVLPAAIEEVVRFDPPVQNTRRFLAADAQVLGAELRAGQGILVLLAAANRDPALHADPHRFDPLRPRQRSFTFGAGPHACPGSRLAMTVAASAVRHLLERGVEPRVLSRAFTYRPSVNGRIPLFGVPHA